MTSFSKEDLLPKIPALKVDRSNWLTFKNRVEWATEAKGLIEYLEGTKPRPTNPSEDQDPLWEPSDVEALAVAEYPEKYATWWKENGYVKQLIGSALPETLFIKIRNKTCTSAIWDALANEFENCSCVVAIELQRKLQDLCCAEKGDVRAHFDKMITTCEELASLGHSIDPDDFATMLISSVPASYDSTISAMTTSTKITHLDLTPDVIMTTLIDDYDRRQVKSGKKSTSSGEDAAYSTNSSSKKFSGNCHNCQKKGHKAEDCWEEGSGKASQCPKRKWKGHSKGWSKDSKDKASTADAEGGEPDGVWFAVTHQTCLVLWTWRKLADETNAKNAPKIC